MAARKKTAAAGKRNTPTALELYNAKRRFDVTAEPRGAAARRSRGDAFVVQQHDARRMHYDFRLELDGVLLSWAVPKGPSLSTGEKRLAVQTEDHPVSYRNFEGNIPEGEYGGGPVIVWDRGRWTPEGDPREGMDKGHLTFKLSGRKLKGRYSLVRTRGGVAKGPKSSWLLFKRSDEHARSGEAAQITERLPQSVISGRTVAEVREELARAAAKSTAAGKSPAKKSAKKSARAANKAASKARKGGAESSETGGPPSSALPPFEGIEPQLATLVERAPASGDWVYEIKLDGYRMLAAIEGGQVRLRSRNQLDWSERFAPISRALARLKLGSAILDGELCYLDEHGKSSFQRLQNAMPRGAGTVPDRELRRLRFYVFDVLFHDGVDVRGEGLLERKQRLRILLGKKPPAPLVYSDHLEADGHTAFAQACRLGFEGLIGKRADAPYRGGRSRDWIKLKCSQRQEFVIAGMVPAEDSRAGFRSLIVAVRENGRLVYRGRVGTGFDNRTLSELGKRLRELAVDESPLDQAPKLRKVVWVKPELVCEIAYSEITRDGSLRHPSFQGLRQDKPAGEVVQERAGPPDKTAAKQPSAARKDGAVEVGGVRITHPERVVDESSGLSKGELARYHEAVAPLLLPYAMRRPLALVRCPQGNAEQCFFQKHALPGLSREVKRGRVGKQQVIWCESAAGILELVQFNAMEFHGWGATMDDPAHPDWIVFDLDPDVGLDFGDVSEAALEVREALQSLELRTFVKTTGGKGLHVLVPIEPALDWRSVKRFSKGVADALAARNPERYVATMSKAKRAGRIFVDYLRNGEGATAVLPYSPRARPGATVAMPVDWKDLSKLDPREFTVQSAGRWLKRRRKDPWKDFFTTRQRLPEFDAD